MVYAYQPGVRCADGSVEEREPGAGVRGVLDAEYVYDGCGWVANGESVYCDRAEMVRVFSDLL